MARNKPNLGQGYISFLFPFHRGNHRGSHRGKYQSNHDSHDRNRVSLPLRSLFAATTFCLLGLTTVTGTTKRVTVTTTKPPDDVQIKVGIVQRFGDEPTDQLKLQATPGDYLTLKFKSGQQEQILKSDSMQLGVVMQPQLTSVVSERVVLSTHRSFETAEDSAKQWRSQGLQVEIAQPDRWQVWASRQIYNTPLQRRSLLQSLQAKGNTSAYLDTKVWQQIPQPSIVVNNNRYNINQLEITTNKNLIQVNQGKPEDNYLYSGQMQLAANAYGTYTLINQVPLETYLRGVVPHEIGPGAPYTAVEAQTILARTYALRNLRRFAVDGYELCADTQCQVYHGLKDTIPNADRAIAATSGQVLTHDNQLADAVYSSTTGGVTAAFSDVWNGADRAYLKPVVDSSHKVWNLQSQSLANENNFQRFISMRQGFNETGGRMFRWRKESSMEQMTQDLQKFLKANNSPMANFTTIKQLLVERRSPSGRILRLAAQTDLGKVILEKDEIRNAFSAPRSTLFYLEPLNRGKKELWGYAFVGGGMGHGVGLSQIGSYRLSKLGWNSKRILNFYYPNTQIKPVTQGLLAASSSPNNQ